MRILLVEDERRMASFIERGLKEQQYAVDTVADGQNALMLADINVYDLIILDVMMPDMDGFTVCRQMRQNKVSAPVLMLTARDALKDKVRGLDVGADDYLTKPFAFAEFLARVRALLRREIKDKNTVLKVSGIELNQMTREVKYKGQLVSLTSKEYALLEYMMLHVNQVVTRTMISEHVWNEQFDSFTNVIDVYIKHLRNKFDKTLGNELIQTVRGVGYILKELA